MGTFYPVEESQGGVVSSDLLGCRSCGLKGQTKTSYLYSVVFVVCVFLRVRGPSGCGGRRRGVR